MLPMEPSGVAMTQVDTLAGRARRTDQHGSAPVTTRTPCAVHLYQVIYSEDSAQRADPGFLVLDNRDNPRPDWWEVWPIRHHLLSTPLDEQAFYGFVSPRFGEKTGLAAETVLSFVRAAAADADLVSFSPQVDMGAFFLNLFEQNELFDPGFTDASQAFFDRIPTLLCNPAKAPIRAADLLMDSRQVVVSNYFAARPVFWRRWLSIIEALITCCEDPQDPVGQKLRAPTSYKGGAQRKVFLAERITSTLLACDGHWRVRPWNPFTLAWSASRLNQFPHEAVISDALKIAARETGHPQYLAAFARVRQILSTQDER